MAKFRRIKTLQKFAAVHASIHNHFNHPRPLNRHDISKEAGEILTRGYSSTQTQDLAPGRAG